MTLELTAREARLYGHMHVAENGCWEWEGAINAFGYGTVNLGRRGTKTLVHRCAWETWRGPIPAGHSVLHHCDNPPCFNPDHLFLGTQADNMRDAAAKGRLNGRPQSRRRVPGQANPASRLTNAQVMEIDRRLSGGEVCSSIAADYGVDQETIRRIRAGIQWSHLTGRSA